MFYWLVSVCLLGSMWIGKQPLLQRLMAAALEGQGKLEVSDASWRRANVVCAGFYLLLGIANLAVAFNTSEATWVKSKIVFIVVLFAFTFAQFFWIMRQQPQTPSAQT